MRWLLLSDVHADPEGLQRVLVHADGAWDAVAFLGDAVGYGDRPADAVAALRDLDPAVAVAGNHERMLFDLAEGAAGPADAGIRASLEAARQALGASDWAWLEGLPVRAAVAPDAEPREAPAAEVLHGHPNSETPWSYLLSVPQARAAGDHLRAPLTWLGHTHVPGGFVRREGRWRPWPVRHGRARLELAEVEVAILNPGSVLRNRDAADRSYALWDAEAGVVEVWRVP